MRVGLALLIEKPLEFGVDQLTEHVYQIHAAHLGHSIKPVGGQRAHPKSAGYAFGFAFRLGIRHVKTPL